MRSVAAGTAYSIYLILWYSEQSFNDYSQLLSCNTANNKYHTIVSIAHARRRPFDCAVCRLVDLPPPPLGCRYHRRGFFVDHQHCDTVENASYPSIHSETLRRLLVLRSDSSRLSTTNDVHARSSFNRRL